MIPEGTYITAKGPTRWRSVGGILDVWEDDDWTLSGWNCRPEVFMKLVSQGTIIYIPNDCTVPEGI